MFGRVELPPERLTEMLRLTTHAFEVIQILSRYLFEHGTQMRHGHRCETVLLTSIVEVT